MKQLQLEEIALVCDQERSARRVHFHPKVTVLRGPNKVGKSSLIKSIYRSLGAEVWSDGSFDQLHVKSLLRFSVDGTRYAILHYGKHYALFDATDQLIQSFSSVTRGLGPFLAKLLDFKITLTTQQSELVVPPPAYLFLPFYIDQDKSWRGNWESFEKLKQMKGTWRADLINYHLGIKPNAYYEVKADRTKLEQQRTVLTTQHESLRGVRARLEEKLQAVEFSFDIAEYERHLTELLVESNALKQREENFKHQLVDRYNVVSALEAQIQITRSAATELKADYNYAVDVVPASVTCPTCGASYDNSFAEKFEIAKDEDRCRELLVELEDALREQREAIGGIEGKFHSNQLESERVQLVLSRTQGELRVQDIIENQGREHVRQVIRTELEQVRQQLAELEVDIKDATDRMRSFEDKKRKQDVVERFAELMRRFAIQLRLPANELDGYRKMDSRLKGQGSAWPRTLLAYYYAVLHVMRQYSSSAYCPIVIDAPHQQDPDDENMQNILMFIRDQQPPNSQLVLGVVHDNGVEFGGERVDLNDQYRLLEKDQYDENAAIVNRLLELTVT
jgi:hypothetical protein